MVLLAIRLFSVLAFIHVHPPFYFAYSRSILISLPKFSLPMNVGLDIRSILNFKSKLPISPS